MQKYFLTSKGTFLSLDTFDENFEEKMTYIEVCNKYGLILDKESYLYHFKMTDNVVLDAYPLRLTWNDFTNQVKSGLLESFIGADSPPKALITYHFLLNNVIKINETIVNVLFPEQFDSFMSELKKEDFSKFEEIQKHYRNYLRKLKIQSLMI
jgi:hypothetical protein